MLVGRLRQSLNQKKLVSPIDLKLQLVSRNGCYPLVRSAFIWLLIAFNHRQVLISQTHDYTAAAVHISPKGSVVLEADYRLRPFVSDLLRPKDPPSAVCVFLARR